MRETEFDDEHLWLMRQWLSRSMAPHERFAEVEAVAELRLTEEDCCFLRNFGIAIA